MNKKDTRERKGDATTPIPFSPRPLQFEPVPFRPFQPEPVHRPGGREYVPPTFAELNGAAILGIYFKVPVIKSLPIWKQICTRFYLGVY